MTNYGLQTPTQTYGRFYPQQQNLRIRPVSSFDEVRAAAVDFDGSTFFFPDFANKCIYTKQINVDGTAILNKYALTELPTTQQPTTNNYVTREEFNSTLAEIKTALSNINNSQSLPQEKTEIKEKENTPSFNF